MDHPDQRRLWKPLITVFLRNLGKFQMVILEALESPLFHNHTINHRLTEMNVRTVLDYMARRGHAEWIDLFTN
jgi:ESCRT-II complex subunit VPS25